MQVNYNFNKFYGETQLDLADQDLTNEKNNINIGNVCLSFKKSDKIQGSPYLEVTQNGVRKETILLSSKGFLKLIDANKISTLFLIEELKKMGNSAFRIAILLESQDKNELFQKLFPKASLIRGDLPKMAIINQAFFNSTPYSRDSEKTKNAIRAEWYNFKKAILAKELSCVHGLPQEIANIINETGIKILEKYTDEFLNQLNEQNPGENCSVQLNRIRYSIFRHNSLYLQRNKLNTLPEGVVNLLNLKEIQLQGNQLIKLPGSICNLINLKKLYINGNRLTKLPEEIGNLINLQELCVSDNPLTSLPEGMGQLATLKNLSLSSTMLTSIPIWIGNFTNLNKLSMKDNKALTTLPSTIGKLQNLFLLDLGGTPIASWSNHPDKLTRKDLYEHFEERVRFISERKEKDSIFCMGSMKWDRQLDSRPQKHL